MKSDRELMLEIKSELERLGLKPHESPWMGFSEGSLPRLLNRLRELQPPVIWRDIDPNVPEEWPPRGARPPS